MRGVLFASFFFFFFIFLLFFFCSAISFIIIFSGPSFSFPSTSTAAAAAAAQRAAELIMLSSDRQASCKAVVPLKKVYRLWLQTRCGLQPQFLERPDLVTDGKQGASAFFSSDTQLTAANKKASSTDVTEAPSPRVQRKKMKENGGMKERRNFRLLVVDTALRHFGSQT
jgi:hypothetical protein